MERLDPLTIAPEVMSKVKGGGVFLTAQAGDDLNTMTIGWAQIGFLWGRNIMTVAVRSSRHTFGIIDRGVDFSVSVPLGDMGKELEICGSESGKDSNKLEKCGLEVFPSAKIQTPILHIPAIHYECRIVCKSALDSSSLIEEYLQLYPEKNFHTLYFGEILDCYSTRDEQ